MKSLITFFFVLFLSFHLFAGTGSGKIITKNDTLIIINETTLERLALYRGKVIIVDYYEGDPLKGMINGFEEGVIVVGGESISLDSIKAIRYDKKGNRVGRIFGTGGLIIGILGGILGLFAINEINNVDSGSVIGDILTVFLLTVLGAGALIIGGIWLLISMIGFITGRRKKFFLGKKFRSLIKSRN